MPSLFETGSAVLSDEEVRGRLRRPWGDYPLTILLINPLNFRLAKALAKTRVTPNQVTILSFIVTLGSAIFISSPQWGYQALGGLLLLTGYILDCLDGDLARLKDTRSPMGAMLDPMLDRFGEFAVMFGSAINAWNTTGDERWLVMGIVLVGMSQIYFYLVDAMLKKLPESKTRKNKHRRPITLKGTRVRLGAIEPFVWGQMTFSLLGLTRLGVIVFGIMFAIGSIGELVRIIIAASRANHKNPERFGTHFRQRGQSLVDHGDF